MVEPKKSILDVLPGLESLDRLPGLGSKKWWIVTIAAIFYFCILMVVIWIVMQVSTKLPEQTNAAKAPQSTSAIQNEVKKESIQKPEPSTSTDPKIIIEEAVKKKVGNRLKKIEVNDYAGESSKKMVLVYFTGNDNLTASMIKGGMLMDIAGICENVFTSGLPVEEVFCFITFPVKDVYGNTSEENIMKIGLEKKTASKINWSGVNRVHFDEVADTVWLHPTLRQ